MSAGHGPLHVVEDAAAWAAAAAGFVEEVLGRALAERGRAHLALAGGSTPGAVYRHLAATARLDWTRVELWLGDERAVPPDHPDANALLARSTLVDPLLPAAPHLHLPPAIERDPVAAALAYDGALPPALDLCLLGIGEDGHVASLFPGLPALHEQERRVVAVHDAPKPPPDRITLTPAALAAARSLCVLARGEGKAVAVERALVGAASPTEVPARLAREGTWFLDPAAAALLGGR